MLLLSKIVVSFAKLQKVSHTRHATPYFFLRSPPLLYFHIRADASRARTRPTFYRQNVYTLHFLYALR